MPRWVDHAIAGRADLSLPRALAALKELDRSFHLATLVTRGEDGPPNTTRCDPDCSIREFDGILEYDFSLIREFEAEYDVFRGPELCASLAVAVVDGALAIRGSLPIAAAIAQLSPRSEREIVARYADFMLAAAVELQAELLVAAEPRLLAGDGPYGTQAGLVWVLAEGRAKAAEAELRAAGAVLDPATRGRVRVWPRPLERLLCAEEADLRLVAWIGDACAAPSRANDRCGRKRACCE